MDKHKPEEKGQDLADALKESLAEGVNLEQAKQKLLSQGYSEEEISIAAYQYGSSSSSSAPNKVTEYYQAHPEQAVEAGAKLLVAKGKEDAADARRKALLDSMAAASAGRLGLPGAGIKVEYESKFAHDVGVSFWALMGLGVLLDGGVYYAAHRLHMYRELYAVNGVLTLLLVAFLIKRVK